MVLKLIQSGGFAGRKKTAEEDLSDYPEELKQEVQELFSQPAPSSRPPAKARDKEQYFIEWDGKVMPLHSIKPGKKVKELIGKLKEKLDY